MRKFNINSIPGLTTALFLAFSTAASAVTTPVLSLADSAGNTITIDGSGLVTYGGNCTPTTCTTTSVSSISGFTSWTGTIGTFSIRNITAVTKPVASPNPSQDLSLQHISTTTGGTLTIRWTDTDFNYSDIPSATLAAGGTIAGSGSATFATYFDNSNTPFGTGVPVGILGPFSTSAFNGSFTGPGPTAAPFSMTEVLTLSLGPGGSFGTDYEFIPLPAPLKLVCAPNSAEVGVLYNASLMALGGISPYSYSILTGSLPAGLTLDQTTGIIMGTPTMGGTAGFTAQVVDASEGTANTVSSNCSIVVTTPPPIGLSCPISTGLVNTLYTSALAASGGIPPYTYSLKSGSLPNGLMLTSNTGSISGTPTQAGPFNFVAQVQDSTNNSAGATTSNCGVTIDTLPTASCPTVTSGEVGVFYSSSMVPSAGAGGPYTFSDAVNLPPGLSIDSNGNISGTPTTAGSYAFTVSVKDGNNVSATVGCTITIAPPPALVCSTTSGGGEVGVAYDSGVMSVSGGTPGYTFFVSSGTLPAGLGLNASTGEVTGTPSAGGTFSIGVKDSKGVMATGNCPITIAGPPVLTCSTTAGGGEVGVAYDSGVMSVSGGTPGYTFFVSSGTLPAGLGLNASTGEVTGTPSAGGTFSIGVKDSKGVMATGNCPITIAGPPVLTCSTTAGGGEVGVAYDSGVMSVSGGTPGYTFFVSSGTLPAGLGLNASTGEVTGTPSAGGTFSIGVKDSKGVTATGNCPITIAGPPVLTCSTTAGGGEVGVAYDSGVMSVSGGTPGYTFFVSSGTLPAGLGLNASTGEVTGTPSAGGTFSIGVKDSKGVMAAGNCPITIAGPPVLTCSTTAGGGEVGVAYDSGVMSVSGGTPGYTFFVSSGTLPAGLGLNASTGEVTGTPSAGGTFSIGVKDSKGVMATGNCPITIAGPPVLTCSTSAGGGEVGVAYDSGVMSVSGGTPGYTFFVSSGTLPAGLGLNASTGEVTGTPSAGGTFSIGVKDSKGVMATGNCPITIAGPPVLTCSTSAGGGEVGVAYDSGVMSVSGGTPGYTFFVSSGTLPAGLGLNASTGEVTGTPSAGGTFSIGVKDSKGVMATGNCPITIAGPPVLTCSTSAGGGEVGVAYDSGVMSVSGGTPGYTFFVSSGTLPAGLGLNASTGEVTGTPSAGGTFSIGVKDSKGVTATGNCPITIAGPPVLTCSTTNSGIVGVYFNSGNMTVIGGFAPYTFSIASGSLPTGLTLNQSSGAVTGTPTSAGSFNLRVQDAKGAIANGTCPFTIYPQISASCLVINAIQGVAITPVTMAASGGTGMGYSFSASGLPNGLTMSSGGTISGTPTVSGPFPYTITITDSAGNKGTVNCSLTVTPPVTPLSLLCPAGTAQLHALYSSTAAVSGGVGPYTFSVATGSLPPGLTLNTSTGAITGTPTSAGTFSFTLKVKDSTGATALSACTSACSAVATWNFDVPSGALGTSQAYTANGLTVTAYGFTLSGSPIALFGKNAGGDENGLGLNGLSDSEIDTSHFIQLDLTNLIASGAQNAQIVINSVQSGEGYSIYGSNTLGSLGSLLIKGGLDGVAFGIPGYPNYKYISVLASSGNVLVGAVSVTMPNCSIVVTAPVNLQCGSCGGTKATFGISYSSQLSAAGGTGPYTYSILSGSLPPGLLLNSATGVISGTPTAAGTYTFTSQAKDSNGNTDTAMCTIVVQPAPIDLECGSCGGGKPTIGTAYSSQLSVTGGTGPFTFSIVSGSLPPGLNLNTTTGVISGTPTTTGTYSFTSKVVDSKGSTDTAYCTIAVVPSPVDLECGSCGSGKANTGVAYSSQLSATGGKGPYTYSIISGSLPPGLLLNASTGVISGSPTTAGSYMFTSKAVDANGYTDTTVCTIVVVAPPVGLDCGTCGASNAKVGAVYSATYAVTGGKASYTFSIISGALPPGLSLNASTGVIYGTPTIAGTYSFTAKVVDANGSSDTQLCTIVVAGSTLNLDCGTCGASKATVGVTYSAQYSVSGGTGPFTYSIISGALPPGLYLNSTTGVISGKPTTAGNYTFTAKVVDAHGNSDTQACTVAVTAVPLDLECGSCGSGNGTVGSAYSSQLSVTGGIGPFTYSILSGSLPSGLMLNASTGVISGSPTTAGSFTFTSKVVDSKGNTDTTMCTIVVVSPSIDLQCGSCGAGKATTGTAYSSTLSVIGGTPGFTFSIIAGSLPAGLSLNTSTGVISGSPTTAGSYTFTSKVVDAKGKSDTTSCTIAVQAPPVNLDCGPCSASKAWAGQMYSATMKATGGSGQYTYSVVSGSLPAGLALNASTGTISGTPSTPGTYTFTSKAVDPNGNSDTDTCTIVVQGSTVQLACGSCGAGNGYQGLGYSSTMQATGGSKTYIYSIISGSLPPGLSLNSATGVISGTPTTPGNYTFTSKAVDAYGNSDTTTCTVKIMQSYWNWSW